MILYPATHGPRWLTDRVEWCCHFSEAIGMVQRIVEKGGKVMFHTKYLTWGEVGKMRYHLTQRGIHVEEGYRVRSIMGTMDGYGRYPSRVINDKHIKFIGEWPRGNSHLDQEDNRYMIY
jgi:hypothetical protein